MDGPIRTDSGKNNRRIKKILFDKLIIDLQIVIEFEIIVQDSKINLERYF